MRWLIHVHHATEKLGRAFEQDELELLGFIVTTARMEEPYTAGFIIEFLAPYMFVVPAVFMVRGEGVRVV